MLGLLAMIGAEAEKGAHVWHFWLAVLLTAATVLAIVATIAGYLFKVTRTRYPRK
ncbi:MAG: hypothetical protein R2698_04125 [Microthrixaceae bacterium]